MRVDLAWFPLKVLVKLFRICLEWSPLLGQVFFVPLCTSVGNAMLGFEGYGLTLFLFPFSQESSIVRGTGIMEEMKKLVDQIFGISMEMERFIVNYSCIVVILKEFGLLKSRKERR